VLKVSESHGWSGGAAQLRSLAIGLKARGAQVAVACPPGGELWRRLESDGFDLFPFEPFQDYDVFTAWRLAGIIKKLKPDIVHAHHNRAHGVALASTLFLRPAPPLVVTRRVSFKIWAHPFSKLKYLSRRIKGYVAVAGNIRDRLLEIGVEPERVTVIPSATDPADYPPSVPDAELARELKLPAGVPVIGKIGHHGAWKGQDVFLKAAAKVLKSRRAVFISIGRDTDGPELGGLVRELGIEDSVRLLGFRRDVPRLLSLMSACVNAAVEGEGISGALREALAMGVPVIASDAGGNRELVEPGRTGELFPVRDDQALADKISGLLEDPARAKKLAEAGRAKVLDEFGVDRMVERTLEFYDKVLGRGAAKAFSTSGSKAR
jgi:glycosyltransferase involved in cell wall biosynthesis